MGEVALQRVSTFGFSQSHICVNMGMGRSSLVPLASPTLTYASKYLVVHTRVGVKYNWSSTQIIQVLVIKYKYKYFELSQIKYSSTSSTDTPSTSTSTSVNIGWLIYIREIPGW